MRVFVALALTLTLAACANKKSDTQTRAPLPPPADLSNKSLQEVLDLKYSKAQLTCKLWTQLAESLDLSAKENDSHTIDFNGINEEMSFDLIGIAGAQTTKATVTLQSVVIQDVELSEVDAKYRMAFSPVGQINVTYSQSPVFDNGVSISGNGVVPATLFENVRSVPVNVSAETKGGSRYLAYVSCTLETKAHPQYKDQWVKVN